MQNGGKLKYNIIFYEKSNGKSDIWELRPGNNRIFYFFCDTDGFILLHSFRKKSKKTPHREIEKAKSERNNYLLRKGNLCYEKLERL